MDSTKNCKERLDDEVISTVTLNCTLFHSNIGSYSVVIFIIKVVHLLKYLYGKRRIKIRTCGNCAYLVKKDRKNYYYRVYKCMNEDSDCIGS